MQLFIIKSQEELLNWAADLVDYGLHRPNQYTQPDTNNLSAVDIFTKLDITEVNFYIGMYCQRYDPNLSLTEEQKLQEQDDLDNNLYDLPDGLLNRIWLGISEDAYAGIPKPEDYPIIYGIDWCDDFDRSGKVRTRYVFWESLKSIPDFQAVAKTKNLWLTTYSKEFAELVEFQKSLNLGWKM